MGNPRIFKRSGQGCGSYCDHLPGSECRPIYQAGGPSAYACVPSKHPAVAHVSHVRHWAHTVDPRGCRSGLGCRSGAMSRRRAQLASYPAIAGPYAWAFGATTPYSPLFRERKG